MFSKRTAVHLAVVSFLVGLAVFSLSVQLHAQWATQAIISTADGNGYFTIGANGAPFGTYSGDNGPAINAGLDTPFGVAVDTAGNRYIADAGNCRVRRVDGTTGIITTVAGGNGGNPNVTTTCNYNGDNIPATSATLSSITDVAVDNAGNIYITDNQRIRKVDSATGLITTAAGTGALGYNGDNIPATSAMLNGPSRLALDSTGNLYISDSGNQRVRRVDATTGIITTVAGNGFIGSDGYGGFSGDGGLAIDAELNGPAGLAFDGAGNLYIADQRNIRVRLVNAGTGVISTVAGNGTQGYNGDGILATAAELNNADSVAVDHSGNIYIAEYSNDRIRRVDAVTGLITTVAGVGVPGYNGDNIAASRAQLDLPVAVALDSNGYLYIADAFNERIRKVAPPAIIVSPSSLDFGAINIGRSSAVRSLTLTFIVSSQVGGISVLTQGVSGKDFQSTSGTTCTATTYTDGSSCALNLVFTPKVPGIRTGEVILYDTASPPNVMGTVSLSGTGTGPMITLEPGVITTVAGTSDGFSGDNGPAVSAQLSSPLGAATDGAGNLYIVDEGNRRVRKVDATTGVITTLAGGGSGCAEQSDTIGDGCAASQAILSNPWDVAVDFSGNVYISDYSDNRIRRVDAATSVITTFAGGGTGCSTQTDTVGDNCSATSATFFSLQGIALDNSGNLYIADYGNSRVRRVDAITGFITNVAGNGIQGSSGDGGLATNAELAPVGVAVDEAGAVYVADFAYSRVRKVDAITGIITTFACTGIAGYSGDNGLAINAQLALPWSLRVDAAGDLYIADHANSDVRKVDAATGVIRTIVGGVGGGCATQTDPFGDNCAATLATLQGLYGIAVDGGGQLYVADGDHSLIRAISLTTPPLNFSDTDTGSTSAAQTITVSNIGNASLTFSDLTTSQNFGIDAGTTTCSASSPLVRGDSCQIGVVFSPTTGGSLAGTLALTDDSGNVSGNIQQVQLSGTGGTSSSQATTTSISAPSISFGNPGIATVTVGSNGGTVTGNVSLTVDGGSALVQPLSAGSSVFTINGLSVGSHSLSASYAAQGNFDSSSAIGSLQVSQAQPPVSINDIPSNAVFSGSFTTTYAYTGDGTTSVSSSTTTTCTVSGSTVNFIGVGTCTLTASATATTNYAAATGTPQSFSIAQATSTISINNIPGSAVYGVSFTPTYAYTGDGTTSVTSGTGATCTVSGNVVSFVGAGTCTLTAHATAGTHYAATTGNPQLFNIAQARPTISINNIPTIARYAGNFTPTYAYTGDGATSATSSTTGTCMVSGSVVNFVGVGTCTLTAHATATVNSAAAIGSPQSFSVSQATPTISISNIPTSAAYKGTFTPRYSYTGNGKSSTTSSTPSSCTVSSKGVVSFVGVGTCTLTAHATATTNYAAATGSPQSVTIGQATTTISIKDIPGNAKRGGSFTPTYNYIGDGTPSTTSNTPAICSVSGSLVSFVASGTCTLTAQATPGPHYAATAGNPQSFTIK